MYPRPWGPLCVKNIGLIMLVQNIWLCALLITSNALCLQRAKAQEAKELERAMREGSGGLASFHSTWPLWLHFWILLLIAIQQMKMSHMPILFNFQYIKFVPTSCYTQHKWQFILCSLLNTCVGIQFNSYMAF